MNLEQKRKDIEFLILDHIENALKRSDLDLVWKTIKILDRFNLAISSEIHENEG